MVSTIPLNRDFVFADHYEVNGAVVSFGGINAGSAAARFTAKDDPDGPIGNDAVGDGAIDHVTSVAIRFGAETKIVALASPFVNPVMVGGHAFTITGQADGSVIVDGLVNGATIATYTATGFNSLEVAYVSGNPFIITGFGTASVLTEPVIFNVPVEVVDADGDAAASNIDVTLLASPTVVVDIVDPTLSDSNNSSVVTFTFSEAPTNFSEADISVSAGLSLVGGLAGSGRRQSAALDGDGHCDRRLRRHRHGDGRHGLAGCRLGNTGIGGADTVAIDTADPQRIAEPYRGFPHECSFKPTRPQG